MSSPLLSIIVPVFNKQRYLSASLDSLLNQTFTDSEIIIINDGSTDDSLNIIKEYQSKCARIRVIDQKNAGASAARNRGIEAACGKYLMIFDADDLIDENMHQNMVRCAEQFSAELVACNFMTSSDSVLTPSDYDYPYEQLIDREYIEKIVIPNSLCKPNGGKFISAHWTLLIKRSVLIDNNIRYNELHKKEEDKPFVMHTLKCVQRMAFVKERHYIYKKIGNTLINQYSPRFDNLMRNFMLYNELFSDIFDFTSKDWTDYFLNVFEECIQFVIIHKKDVKSVKEEIMHIINSPESKANILLIKDEHCIIRTLYEKNKVDEIYKYYMKKYRKLRIKIAIRDIVKK